MKDEEIAEEYANKHMHYEVGKREGGTDYAKKVSDVTIQQAFLDGLRLGRQDEHLTKAKKIIQELLDTQNRLDPYRDIFKDRIVKAEQFLNEVVR